MRTHRNVFAYIGLAGDRKKSVCVLIIILARCLDLGGAMKSTITTLVYSMQHDDVYDCNIDFAVIRVEVLSEIASTVRSCILLL